MSRAHTAFIVGLCFAFGFVTAGGLVLCGWVQVVVLVTTCLWMPLKGAIGRFALFLLAMAGGVALWYALSPAFRRRPALPDHDALFWVVEPLASQVQFAAGAGLVVLAVRWALAEARAN